MADASHLLDPEVEAILQEVAKDPRSILLRVERPELLAQEVASGREIVVRGLTGLTAAEKELLTVRGGYAFRPTYVPNQTGKSNFLDNTAHINC